MVGSRSLFEGTLCMAWLEVDCIISLKPILWKEFSFLKMRVTFIDVYFRCVEFCVIYTISYRYISNSVLVSKIWAFNFEREFPNFSNDIFYIPAICFTFIMIPYEDPTLYSQNGDNRDTKLFIFWSSSYLEKLSKPIPSNR